MRAVGISANTANVVNSGYHLGGNIGIFASTATVVNSGTISGATGISSFGATNVTNAGTIIGTGGTALRFSAAADMLTLLPGSRIIGAINMGGGADVVNGVTGRDVSWLMTLKNFTGVINGSGTAPFSIYGNRIATVDVTR